MWVPISLEASLEDHGWGRSLGLLGEPMTRLFSRFFFFFSPAASFGLALAWFLGSLPTWGLFGQ